MATTINYQSLARKFIIIPLVLILLIGSLVYITGDILITMRNEVAAANNVNKLLAKSIASRHSVLISQQVQQLMDTTPQYESIMYYPLHGTTALPKEAFTNRDLLFAPTLSLNEPVTESLIAPNNTKRTENSKATISDSTLPPSAITGYVNLTLNLNTVRGQWLLQSLPTLILVLLIWLITLSILLARLRHLTNRLPLLESLSKKALINETSTEESYKLPKESTSSWLFEQALIHLLNRQKLLGHQIEQLQAENEQVLQDKSKLIRQNSSFQNTLAFEFKESLGVVESGIQMLKNQYISKEQEDALETISQGSSDLNSKLNQIIQLARIEKGQTSIQFSQFSPTQFINEIVEQNQTFAHEKSLTLTAKIYHADYVLETDIQKVSTILHSLIENAVYFTEQGSIEVVSQLQHLGKHIRWTIQVIDTGIGIQKEDIENLFEPFFQVNSEIKHSHNAQTVGLFLVDKIVTILGGDIHIESQPNQGSKFIVNIPVHDWKDQYERNLLRDKIITYWGSDEPMVAVHQRLEESDALVQGFDESELLMEYLITHRVDILLISPSIAYHDVLSFIKQLRDIETSHRLLVVYYYLGNQLNAEQQENLSIEGVDYFDKVEFGQNINNTLIRKIIQYLN